MYKCFNHSFMKSLPFLTELILIFSS
uniref:Uncharacterized protein n=1 Tax=Anguilla anguilla TaxID=7936 RepID=A0A0E9SH51_ANGAN